MLSINISEVVWTLILFVILVFILDRVLFKPILKVMDEREAKIETLHKTAASVRKQAVEEAELDREAIRSAGLEAGHMVERARQNDQSAADGRISAAKAKSQEGRLEADIKMKAARERAEDKLASSVDGLADILADNMLGCLK